MSKFIKYQLEDGQELLVETDEIEAGTIMAGNESEPAKAAKSFSESLDAVKSAAQTMRQKFADLAADETEVTFALKTTGEVGMFGVAKVGADAIFQVTMKWKKASATKES
jgi:hypothetical protein